VVKFDKSDINHLAKNTIGASAERKKKNFENLQMSSKIALSKAQLI
jgi:hypothetical protein